MYFRLLQVVLVIELLLFVLGCGCTSRPCQESEPQPETTQLSAGNPTLEDVEFRHAGNTLSGTLFRPNSAGRHPAVVLILGSGAWTREYGGVGTALGKFFAHHGFACLTWDKPGLGQSTGQYLSQTFHDRAGEALAAVRFLQQRADIRRDRIGLWGHSQGGTVAPLAASLSDEIAFIIEVAGWQGPVWQQDVVRVESELRAEGFPEADVQKAITFASRRMDLIRGSAPFEELDREQEAVKTLSWFKHVHRCDPELFYGARRSIEYDPRPSWEKVHCPVLAIFGDKDKSTGRPQEHVAIIRSGLVKARNRDVTVTIIPNADHSFCTVKTTAKKEAGNHNELRRNEDSPDFLPDYLNAMTTWLAQRFGLREE